MQYSVQNHDQPLFAVRLPHVRSKRESTWTELWTHSIPHWLEPLDIDWNKVGITVAWPIGDIAASIDVYMLTTKMDRGI